jgi:Pyruvate/2-oxoglutarate dehydrogenase complex, dihydrolipoamide acyltransferase (E2) component, and related enzymes
MADIVMMPKEGITVESCLVGSWHKNVGEPVAKDDVLFEYETDKATFECLSTANGVLLHKFCNEGEETPVLTPAAIIGSEGEDISGLIGGASEQQTTSSSSNDELEANSDEVEKVEEVSEVAEVSSEQSTATGIENEAPIASPRARIFAAEQGIDLAGVVPTGPGGRIIEADVIAAANSLGSDEQVSISNEVAQDELLSAKDEVGGEALPVYVDEPYTKIRAVIAKTMASSLQRSAQLTHHHSFDATAMLAMREDFKSMDEAYEYGGVSVGDIVLYVVSRALAKHPEINALVADEGIRKYNIVNLGVAVDTPRGLMVPTIFNAEKKGLREISKEVKTLAASCKEGRISPDYLRGGTFTVSNLGATGVEIFTPIINPPQAAILGVCGITSKVKEGENGQPIVYPSIGLSLTYDHRAIDGAPASRFASELCKALAEFSWKTIAIELERGAL